MKKQIQILSLILMAMLLFTGCAESPRADTNEAAAPESAAPDNTAEEQESPEIASPEREKDGAATEKTDISTGRIEGDCYVANEMGLKFVLPDGWTFLSGEQIAEQLGWNAEYAASSFAEITEAGYPYIDMWAQNSDGSTIVQLMYEKTEVNFGRSLTAKEYIAHCAKTIPESYQAMNAAVSDNREYTKELQGVDMEVFSFTSTIGNNVLYQTMLAAEKGEYIFSIYITCFSEDLTEDIFSMFSPA